MPSTLARFRVDLLLLLVAITWGSTYLVAKELVSPSSVVALLALRMLLAAAIMAAVATARRKRVTAAEMRVGVILGMLLSAVFAFETFGIAHTSATNAGLIISLTIVFTPILDSVATGRRLPGMFFLAAAIAVIGVVLLAGNGAFRAPTLGDLLILVAAIVRAVHVTGMHKLTADEPMDSLHLTAVQLATCAALFSATTAFYGDSIPRYLSQLDPGRVLLFFYLVLACTVFAFFVQTWAVRRTSASRVSLLLGTEPVWAAIVGITIANDKVGLPGYFGIALVLSGTALGQSIENRHRQRTHEPSGKEQQAVCSPIHVSGSGCRPGGASSSGADRASLGS